MRVCGFPGEEAEWTSGSGVVAVGGMGSVNVLGFVFYCQVCETMCEFAVRTLSVTVKLFETILMSNYDFFAFWIPVSCIPAWYVEFPFFYHLSNLSLVRFKWIL